MYNKSSKVSFVAVISAFGGLSLETAMYKPDAGQFTVRQILKQTSKDKRKGGRRKASRETRGKKIKKDSYIKTLGSQS